MFRSAPANRSIPCLRLTWVLTTTTLVLAGGFNAAPATAQTGSAARSDDPRKPRTIVVIGRPDNDADGPIAPRSAVTGTRTETPIAAVPQAISVIPRRQLDEQAVKSVGDGLRYTPGVFADTRIGGVLESVFLRGFGGFAAGATNPQLLDGLPLAKGGGWAAQVIDPYALDRIEVLRGPASVLLGQASPGGVVNMATKQPTERPYHEILLATGNRNRAEAAFDASGPLGTDWGYRVTGLGRRVDEQADHSKQQRLLLAPTLVWTPDAATRVTLTGFYQNDPDNNFAGWLPAAGTLLSGPAGPIRRSFFAGEPGFDSYDRQQYMVGYAMEHRFDDTWTLRQTARYAHIDTRFEGVAVNFIFPFATATRLNRAASWSDEAVDALALDQQIEARFATGPLRHTLLVGIAYQGSWSDIRASGFGYVPPIDVVAPVYGQAFAAPALAQAYRQNWDRIGVYAQDQIRLGRLAVTLGGREDRSKLATADRLAATATARQDDRAFTSRIGAAFLFENGLAPYASYSTSFEPVLGTRFEGRAFRPSRARQSEAGVKYQPPAIDGFVAISGFDITQTHVSTADPLHPFFTIQSGEVRSRGIEVEARAALTGRLEVIGAYTWLDTTVRRDTDPARIGKRFVAVPEQLASLWSNYRFPGGMSLSAGVRHVGRSAGDPGDTLRVPAVTLVDGAVRYDFGAARPALKGLQAALNVSNLLDRTYVASCFDAGGCFYGNGRIVTISLGYRW